jgi:hypothetical protein
MFGRPTTALFGAAALSVALLAQPIAVHAQSGAGQTTIKESASPINDQGNSYNYRSNITSVTPNVPGLGLEVLEFADRLLLTNHTGQTVTVYGYQGEPYARVLANGTAEQNTRSPATYLNTSFYGNVTVPASANPSASPHWVVVDRTGQFEWHDHRIHWMSPLTPPQVKDKSRRTLIFDWQVPIRVGTQMGGVSGQLYWTPESSRASTAVIVLGVTIALLGLLFVLFVRRRRSRIAATEGSAGSTSGGDGTSGGGGGSARVVEDSAGGAEAPAKEAW